jgi:hypothetical protein
MLTVNVLPKLCLKILTALLWCVPWPDCHYTATVAIFKRNESHRVVPLLLAVYWHSSAAFTLLSGTNHRYLFYFIYIWSFRPGTSRRRKRNTRTRTRSSTFCTCSTHTVLITHSTCRTTGHRLRAGVGRGGVPCGPDPRR